MSKLLIRILLFFFPLYLPAQDLRGIWKGFLQTPETQLQYELAITNPSKNFSGYSCIIYVKDGVENIGVKTVKLKQKKKDIYFEDGELVYDNFSTQSRRIIMKGNLTLIIKERQMVLMGAFNTRSLDFRDARTYSGEIYLQKQTGAPAAKMLPVLEEKNLINTLSFISVKDRKIEPTGSSVLVNPFIISPKQPIRDTGIILDKKPIIELTPNSTSAVTERKTEIIRTVTFSSDSLLLNLVDNGTVDGDSISIYLNGRIIVEKLGLTSRTYRLMVPVTASPGDSLLLVMYAESLGTIPPNSGLLIIQDGNSRHDIRFEGDMQKSSGIILKKRR